MSTRSIPWPRIFAEGFAVVVSILLAFGIQAWWDARQDREAEREALELIHADLIADTTDIGESERTADRHQSGATWLLARWDDPVIDADSVAAALGEFFVWPVVQPQRSAYPPVASTQGGQLCRARPCGRRLQHSV